MAEKKRTSNKKTASSAAKGGKSGKNIKSKNSAETAAMRAVAEAEQGGTWISSRAICAIVVLALFVLFTVILLKPEGALLELVYAFLLGIIGKAAFFISVPALLCLFLILITSRGKPVKLSCFCLIGFVLVCGCLSDFMMSSTGVIVISALY